MKVRILCSLAISALLAGIMPASSYADDFAAFLLRDVGSTPRWYASDSNADRYFYTVDLLAPGDMSLNVSKAVFGADGSLCPTAHLRANKGRVKAADMDEPSITNGRCSYQLNINNPAIIKPGAVVTETTIQNAAGEEIDEGRVLIRVLADISVTHRDDGDELKTTIDPDAFADGTMISLIDPGENVTDMSLSIFSGTSADPFWRSEVAGTQIKLPNAALCRVTNTRPLNRIVVVNAIERSGGFTNRNYTVSRLNTSCTTQAL